MPDADLLFGVLALQLELIDERRFIDACGVWAVRKDVPLADVLLQRGDLSPDDRAQVEGLLSRKLRKHGNDPRVTLGAVADAAARGAIEAVDDPEVRKSISSLPPAAGHVLVET